jgi:hypothetical protein
MAAKDEERAVFSAWPSWKDFFKESIAAVLKARWKRRNLDNESLGRVLILQAATTTRIGSR